MEIFIDTASLKEIKEFLPWGVISGVTTNQKIFSNEKGINFKDRVQEILSAIDAPVSIEVTKTNETDQALLAEAKEYSRLEPEKHSYQNPNVRQRTRSQISYNAS